MGQMEEDDGSKFKVTVYINFDEDDDNSNNIDLGDLFKREDLKKPYFVQMQILDHYTCMELIVDALDLFNKRLVQIGAPYTLNDDSDKIEDNYSMYIAKKKGLTKDDLPPLSFTTNVQKTNYDRFSLCVFSHVFQKQFGDVKASTSNKDSALITERQNRDMNTQPLLQQ